MTAWILIVVLGAQNAQIIPNIASEEACEALKTKIRAEFYYTLPRMRCISYETTVGVAPPPD